MRILTLVLTAAVVLSALNTVSAQTRVEPQRATPPGQTLQKKAPSPVRAKPDLVVVQHMKAGPAKALIRVENQGTGGAPASTLWIRNENNLGAHSYQIGPIPAGHGKWVEAVVWSQVEAGDQFLVEADFTKKVVESNENNNKYQFTW